jgi:hypothetical protein
MTKKKLHRTHNLTTNDAIDDAMVDIDTMTSSVFMDSFEAIDFLEIVKTRIEKRISDLKANLGLDQKADLSRDQP